MFVGIEGVDADADSHDADLHQGFRHAVIDQHTIGAEHDDKAESDGMAGNVQNVGSHERLPASNDQQAALVYFSDLVD